MTTTDSNEFGGDSGHPYTFTRRPGITTVDAVVARQGKNFSGRVLGAFLGSIGQVQTARGAEQHRDGDRNAARQGPNGGTDVEASEEEP